MGKILLLMILGLMIQPGFGQERYTENTLKLKPNQESPAIAIEEMKWLAGHWSGETMGGLSEEIWSASKGGSMMGMYRFISKDKIVFYELMTIVQEKDSLILRIKHFNPGLKGWEEKDKTNDFRFIAKRERIFYFEGMTFKPQGQTLTIFLATRGKDGNIAEEKFVYRSLGARLRTP